MCFYCTYTWFHTIFCAICAIIIFGLFMQYIMLDVHIPSETLCMYKMYIVYLKMYKINGCSPNYRFWQKTEFTTQRMDTSGWRFLACQKKMRKMSWIQHSPSTSTLALLSPRIPFRSLSLSILIRISDQSLYFLYKELMFYDLVKVLTPVQ